MWGMHGPFAVRIVDTLGAEDPWHSYCPMSTGTHEGLCSYPGIERRNCRDKKGIAWHGLVKPYRYRITERSIYLATDLLTSSVPQSPNYAPAHMEFLPPFLILGPLIVK